MTWTDIAVVPAGPVFFGDGRPTTAGDTDFGEGRFPPSPRTMQGVVRTALLTSVAGLDLRPGRERERIAELIGAPEALPDSWQLAGPWLAQWHEGEDGALSEVAPWLPVPSYLVRKTGSRRLVALRPLALAREGEHGMRWDLQGVDHAACCDGRHERAYLDPAALRALLAGKVPACEDEAEASKGGRCVLGDPPFLRPEPRTGLALERHKDVAAESMLYTLNYRRFCDSAGFVLRFRGNLHRDLDQSALTRGTSSLGGRSRLARRLAIASWSSDFEAALRPDHLPQEIADGARFWLWATTPAQLDVPWRPDISPLTHGGARLTVLAAAVGKLEAIGGFSLADQRGNPVRLCCPAGSAWLIELSGGSAAARGQLARELHDNHTIGSDARLRAMGFGHSLLSCEPDARSWS